MPLTQLNKDLVEQYSIDSSKLATNAPQWTVQHGLSVSSINLINFTSTSLSANRLNVLQNFVTNNVINSFNPVFSLVLGTSANHSIMQRISGFQINFDGIALSPTKFSNKSVYAFTGGNQTYTVPPSTYYILVKMWGAGGGAAKGPNSSSDSGWKHGSNGGGGGHSRGIIPVTPGEQLTLVLGRGGLLSYFGNQYGGGGGSPNNSDIQYCGHGGGYAGIFRGSTIQANALMIAGGGGGGGSVHVGSYGGWSNTACGGAGGGLEGCRGEYQQIVGYEDYAGTGGTQTQGGRSPSWSSGSASSMGGSLPTQGTALQGGNCGNNSYGGGGGGGYFGGGGGSYPGTPCMGGGGGGSGYIHPTVLFGGTYAGFKDIPAFSWDADYDGSTYSTNTKYAWGGMNRREYDSTNGNGGESGGSAYMVIYALESTNPNNVTNVEKINKKLGHIHAFTSIGNQQWIAPYNGEVDVLVVAGGGGGGGSYGCAGGGGAGGVVYKERFNVTRGKRYNIHVGRGGYGGCSDGNYYARNSATQGRPGNYSHFNDYMFAVGGGGGNESFYTPNIWINGGSGGGGGDDYTGVDGQGARVGGSSWQPTQVPMSDNTAVDGFAIGYGSQGGSRPAGNHSAPHEGAGGGGAGGYSIIQVGGGNGTVNNLPGLGGDGRNFPQFAPYGYPPGCFGGGGSGGLYSSGNAIRQRNPLYFGGLGGGGRGANMNEQFYQDPFQSQFSLSFFAGNGIKNTGGGGGGGSDNNRGGPLSETRDFLYENNYGNSGGNGGDGIVLIKNSNSIYESLKQSVVINSASNWKDLKVWVNDSSLSNNKAIVVSFKSFISAGPAFYTWRLFNKTKNAVATKISGQNHQRLPDGNFIYLGPSHQYTEQPEIGFAVDPGDELSLQMRGCNASGTTYINNSQNLFVKDLVVFAAGTDQTIIEDQSCYGGQTRTNSFRTIHAFTESGQLVCNKSVRARYMIVAGGGGGGSDMGGGGGAGGYLTGTISLCAGNVYTMMVGTGGIGSLPFHGWNRNYAYNGGNSSILGENVSSLNDLTSVELLVVGGGGGGGVNAGGGGGGGTVIYATSKPVIPGRTYNVFVGEGGVRSFDWSSYTGGLSGYQNDRRNIAIGSNGGNGQASFFDDVVAPGGGGGGNYNGSSSVAGGSPGGNGGGGGDAGSGNPIHAPGGVGELAVLPAGVTGTVYGGRGGSAGRTAAGYHSGGGGAGAGQGWPPGSSLAGGNGVQINFDGNNFYWGGGGGGGTWATTAGSGGLGGGGGGTAAGGGSRGERENQTISKNRARAGKSGCIDDYANGCGGVNTGGGGGGGSFYGYNSNQCNSLGSQGAVGGSGIVMVRYQGRQRAIGGDQVYQKDIGGVTYTIHEFLTTGPALFSIPLYGNNASLNALGGGAGGNSYNSQGTASTGRSGGSGGGASGYNNNGVGAGQILGGAGTAGQGNRGGNQGSAYYSGGGGGAGAAGTSGNSRPNGGIGVWNDILEEGLNTLLPTERSSYTWTVNGIDYVVTNGLRWTGSNLGGGFYWAGGGGGAGYSSLGGYGGEGGGGAGARNSASRITVNGVPNFINDINRGGSGFNPGYDNSNLANGDSPFNGSDGGRNTGGGGGGAGHNSDSNTNMGSRGGRGGSGIVVISYDEGWASTPNLQNFTQINSVGMPHSVVSSLQTQGSTRISFKGASAPSYGILTTEYGFGTHGGHAGSSVFPIYWAFDIGTPQVVNQFKACVHANSWGYFFLEGSNNAGTGPSFATQGTWTSLPTGQVQNMGGFSSGLTEGSVITFNYSNTTPYRYYRIRILDASRAAQPVGTYYGGAAGYSWQFNRI